MEVSLRDSASVIADGDYFIIEHSIWSIRIPSAIACNNAGSHRLLTEPAAKVLYNKQDPILVLLRAQGCLTYPHKHEYANHEYLEIFNAASLSWYKSYYSHSIWDRLRKGRASHSELITWILHNYHVSLNAGITHARIADAEPKLSMLHRKCAIEEYWHADSFYFAKYKGINPEEVKDYLPLPSSYAFQIHLRQLARRHPSAYKLISYFQERTIIFSDGAELFYDDVEKAYDMPGLFKGWRKHIEIDKAIGHHGEREQILLCEKTINAPTANMNMYQANIAFEILLCCLEEIEAEEKQGRDYSSRLTSAKGESSTTGFVLTGVTAVATSFLQGLPAFMELIQKHLRLGCYNNAWIKHGIAESAFTALSHARHHDDVMLMGNIAHYFSSAITQPIDHLPTLQEISFVNHLRELSLSDRGDYIAAIIVYLSYESSSEPSAKDLRSKIYSRLSKLNPTQLGLKVFQAVELLSCDILDRKPIASNYNVI